jgi:hypothetical protein
VGVELDTNVDFGGVGGLSYLDAGAGAALAQ